MDINKIQMDKKIINHLFWQQIKIKSMNTIQRLCVGVKNHRYGKLRHKEIKINKLIDQSNK